MTTNSQNAALGTLIILQLVMLAALFTKTVPHPPDVIPLGGMAPFVAAGLCAAMAAIVVGAQSVAGMVLSGIACLVALASYGPHKYFDAAFPLVWPAVIAAQVSMVVLIVAAVMNFRTGRAGQ